MQEKDSIYGILPLLFPAMDSDVGSRTAAKGCCHQPHTCLAWSGELQIGFQRNSSWTETTTFMLEQGIFLVGILGSPPFSFCYHSIYGPLHKTPLEKQSMSREMLNYQAFTEFLPQGWTSLNLQPILSFPSEPKKYLIWEQVEMVHYLLSLLQLSVTLNNKANLQFCLLTSVQI